MNGQWSLFWRVEPATQRDLAETLSAARRGVVDQITSGQAVYYGLGGSETYNALAVSARDRMRARRRRGRQAWPTLPFRRD